MSRIMTRQEIQDLEPLFPGYGAYLDKNRRVLTDLKGFNGTALEVLDRHIGEEARNARLLRDYRRQMNEGGERYRAARDRMMDREDGGLFGMAG